MWVHGRLQSGLGGEGIEAIKGIKTAIEQDWTIPIAIGRAKLKQDWINPDSYREKQDWYSEVALKFCINNKLQQRLSRLKQSLNKIDTELNKIETAGEKLKQPLNKIETELNKIEAKLGFGCWIKTIMQIINWNSWWKIETATEQDWSRLRFKSRVKILIQFKN
mgnify:CR=1 FL=1